MGVRGAAVLGDGRIAVFSQKHVLLWDTRAASFEGFDLQLATNTSSVMHAVGLGGSTVALSVGTGVRFFDARTMTTRPEVKLTDKLDNMKETAEEAMKNAETAHSGVQSTWIATERGIRENPNNVDLHNELTEASDKERAAKAGLATATTNERERAGNEDDMKTAVGEANAAVRIASEDLRTAKIAFDANTGLLHQALRDNDRAHGQLAHLWAQVQTTRVAAARYTEPFAIHSLRAWNGQLFVAGTLGAFSVPAEGEVELIHDHSTEFVVAGPAKNSYVFVGRKTVICRDGGVNITL
jgi:hypothetical protein